MTTESAPMYTLDEAAQVLRRQACERDGHAPVTHLRTISDWVGVWLCDCTAVTWRAGER